VGAPQNLPANDKVDDQLLIAQGCDHNWMRNKRTKSTTGSDGLNLTVHVGRSCHDDRNLHVG
jgi:hypothetical protein